MALSPHGAAAGWRLVGQGLLCVLWITGSGRPAGLAVILFLAGLGLLRWRLPLPGWVLLVDQAACAAALPLWPGAVFGLCLPLFDAAASARPWFALPLFVIPFVAHSWSLSLGAVLCLSAAGGASLALWDREIRRLRGRADEDRRERFELERLRDELALAGVQAGRAAELAERARIAREIHDHLGHEVTAAALALEAFERLWKEADPQAGELLAQARERMGRGMEVMRTTVHGLAPRRGIGVGALEEICRGMADLATDFIVSGDTTRVPAYGWAVLEPSLKEALTNAARHGVRGRVTVSLDVGPRIVRLSVHSHGQEPGAPRGAAPGLGLRSLRERARAVGGSIAVDSENGFRLVCVLPLAVSEEA
jgi:two-component system, NarL family, sensor histidine kinase DesK